ncbi:MAG: FliA/WhiG family RNA polymerase sigma factor [Terriglobia bacterium]|jgi:RNA polymerase sigma factor for flagellar operon FliA
MANQKPEFERGAKVEVIRLRPHSFPPSGDPHFISASTEKGQAPPRSSSEPSDASRNRKVIEMLPLLHRVARKMRAHLPSHVEVDDLVGAGALGLIDAVQKFDASKNVKLESYAQHRIRGAIIDSLRAMDGASRDMRKKNKKAEAAFRELEGRLGRPATDDEFARAQGVSLKAWYKTIQELQALGVEWLRLTDSGSRQHFTEETLPCDGQDDQFDLCYLREKREIFNRALAGLSSRERLILLLYYVREQTMKHIGAQLNIDESRVSQLHSAALLRLRTTVMTLLRAPRHSALMAGDQQQFRAA